MTSSSRGARVADPTLLDRSLAFALGRGVLDGLPSTASWIAALPLLAMRLWLADIFFSAGRVRIESWDSQAFLFTQIHPVPYLPASIAAPMTTVAEIGLPVLLAFGLLGRFGALGLLVMAATIQFVVGQTPQGMENGIANPVHYWWMAIALILTLTGPGRLSIDALLARRFL
ncbi:MAG: DoxX family protein [Alphaproteobacteria bacterium]